MSNIYIQEPPTNGKVLLKTTVGEIEIELWSKEAPKSTRNFLQCVLDKKYDKTLFHRLIPSFIVQCGENVCLPASAPVHRIETHSRLRFTRRGLVALAQCEGNETTMEFFFTLGETPELQNKHSLIGKVTGDTIYNMIKLNETQTDSNDRPLYPHKINKVKILHNPFEDMEPSIEAVQSSREKKEDKKPKREGVKNFKLISFGDEAEEDEQEVETVKDKFPKDSERNKESSKQSSSRSARSRSPSPATSSRKKKDRDLREKTRKMTLTPPLPDKSVPVVAEDSDSDYEATLEREKLSELERKKKEIQDQIRDVKKQYQKDKKSTAEVKELEKKAPKAEDEAIQGYLDEKEKYKSKKLTAKGASREEFTMQLLAKFKNRLHSALESKDESEATAPIEDSDDENWLGHKLDFSESQEAVLAKDASKKEDDWYDIFDPRNPLNKRKRGDDKTSRGESSSSKVRRK